jgi:hypothetical protein
MCLLGKAPRPTDDATTAVRDGRRGSGYQAAASWGPLPEFCGVPGNAYLYREAQIAACQFYMWATTVARGRNENGTAGRYRNAHGQKWLRRDSGGR